MSVPVMESIRAGLSRRLLLWLTLTLLIAGTALYLFMRSVLVARFDAMLLMRAEAIASTVTIDVGPDSAMLDCEWVEDEPRPFETPGSAEFFEMWLVSDGTQRLLASRRAADESSSRLTALVGSDLQQERAPLSFSNLALEDDRPARAVRLIRPPSQETDDEPGKPDKLAGEEIVFIGVTPGSARREFEPIPVNAEDALVVVVLARGRSDIDLPLMALLAALIGGGAALLLAILFAVRWSLLRGLAPLEALGSRVAALDPADLPEHVQWSPTAQELAPIEERIIALMARIRDTVARERRFSVAAAHELRTPLTELRALLDVRLRWPVDLDHCTATMHQARAVVERTEQLVEALLLMARGRTPQPSDDRGPERVTDLSAAVDDAVRVAAASSDRAGITLSAEVTSGVRCRGDHASVRAIVDNLLSNAVVHTPRGGRIDVRLDDVSPSNVRKDFVAARLEIRNGPTDLVQDDLAHLTEPFWRKDAARTQGSDGSRHVGLGLSIVDDFTRWLGARTEAELEEGGVLCVRVTWPQVASRVH